MGLGPRQFLWLVSLLVGVSAASTAFAGATVKVTPTGARADETALRLVDSYGAPLAADPGDPNTFSDLPAGIYLAQVLVGDKPLGPETTIALEEGENQIRIAGAEAIEVTPPLARRQQQVLTQLAWSFAVLGGWKRSPYDTRFTSEAFNRSVSAGLEENGGAAALEARYNFARQQQLFGAQLFLFGTYIHYFGMDRERRFVRLHAASGNDTGSRMKEKHSFGLGLGARWNIAQRVGLELMAGAHATRLEFDALSDESSGGGGDVRIRDRKTIWGPLLAVGLTYPVLTLANGRSMTGIARLTAMRMRDVGVSGRSVLLPAFWDYESRFHGGWQYGCMFGLLF